MRYLLSILFVFSVLAAGAQGQPTTLVVRAKAKDAKFIGSSIGGAYVQVRDALTGKLLAEGLTQGSTGNTQRIMQAPQERYKSLADEQTAKFETSLLLEKPQFVTVDVWAPHSQPAARVHAQTQLWLLPGKHIGGDGLVVEIPGFVVSALSPQLHETIAAGSTIPLKANVVMTCGCPLTAGGIWDAQAYEVEALIYKDGKLLEKAPLRYQSKPSTFEGSFVPAEAGNYEVIITAYDAKTGNTGADKVSVVVK